MPDDLKTPALEMAREAVNKIMQNLGGRSCVGHALERIEDESPDVYREIEDQLSTIIADALLEAQAQALEPYCECLEFEDAACSVCCKITALRAAAEEVENG